MKKLKTSIKKLLLFSVFVLIPLSCTTTHAPVENISAQVSADIIQKHHADPNFVILDIRTPAEFKAGHIAGAILLDFYSKSFDRDFKRLDRNHIYLIYCRSGNRSGKLMRAIGNMGFKKIYNMERGLVDWVGRGYQLTTS